MPDSRCQRGRELVPAVGVDPDEDRLQEEREPLDREPEPEHAAERGREVRPQQPHLEAQDRAGDHPDREQRQHDPAPALRERSVQRVAGPDPQPLDEHHHHRERDPEADQRDVDGERQRLHLASLQKVFLVHRGQSQREREHPGPDATSDAGVARSVAGGIVPLRSRLGRDDAQHRGDRQALRAADLRGRPREDRRVRTGDGGDQPAAPRSRRGAGGGACRPGRAADVRGRVPGPLGRAGDVRPGTGDRLRSVGPRRAGVSVASARGGRRRAVDDADGRRHIRKDGDPSSTRSRPNRSTQRGERVCAGTWTNIVRPPQ